MSFFKKLRFSRHEKLCEEWALANSCERIENDGSSAMSCEERNNAFTSNDEATFANFKYLGSILVETPSSEEATAEAIKTIITMSKASGKKLQRVSLSISLRGIRMTDSATDEDQLKVSMYRISYCSADATHNHVFAFIATNFNETMECHAFLCPKRKVAQTVALTVAQAFNTAYKVWKLSQSKYTIHQSIEKNDDQHVQKQKKQQQTEKSANEKQLLIDLTPNNTKSREKSWVFFEDDDDFNEEETKQNLCNKNDIPLKLRNKK